MVSRESEIIIRRGRERFNDFLIIINIFVFLFKLFPVSVRKFFFNSIKYVKGYFGLGLRYILLKSINNKIGLNVSIHEGVYLFSIENLEIGDNVSIHPMCYIDASGGIYIGNDVSIAHGVSIMSTSHKFDDINVPIKDQGVKKQKTIINNNVWVGAKAMILYGVNIDEGAIIGASSVITHDVQKNSIIVGNPGKVLKIRKFE